MPVEIQIPTPLRPMAGGNAHIEVTANTVGEALKVFAEQYPDVATHLFDGDGKLRRFVNFFLNGDNIRDKEGADSALTDGDTLAIVPAIAGGAGCASYGHRNHVERG